MTAAEIVERIRPLGTEGYRNILRNHGTPEPLFGVKIEELKKIQKVVKKDYQLALDLFETGIYDARYLAGLVADETRMTKRDLNHWVKEADCPALREYTVAGIAAESAHGWELGLKWIDSKDEGIASAGWATLGGVVALTPDEELPIEALRELLSRVRGSIHGSANRVRYTMNGFVIGLGTYVLPLSAEAKRVGREIGPVFVDMGDTSCKTPFAPDYIEKSEQRGTIGKKRKMVRC